MANFFQRRFYKILLQSIAAFTFVFGAGVGLSIVFFYVHRPVGTIPQLETLEFKNARNKYPLILHHGIFPFTSLEPFSQDLSTSGCRGFTSAISAANSVAARAAELGHQIDRVLSETGATKVNIVAHSMGGLDARFLISSLGYGDRVASLSTISTPHRGTPVADFLEKIDSHFLAALADLYAAMVLEGSKLANMDTYAAVKDLTTLQSSLFNIHNPDDAGVYYQSWGGAKGGDISFILRLNWWFLSNYGENDGVIPLASSRWTNFRAPLIADHFSLVGHYPWIGSNEHDPFTFYRNLCEDLINLGF